MAASDTIPTLTKDPNASLVYGRDLAKWLGEGVTIATVTASIAPAGPTVGTATIDGTTVQARVSGGDVGKAYLLTFHFTDSDGNEDERSIRLVMRER